MQNLDFFISPGNFPEIAEQLALNFPSALSPVVKELIHQAQYNGDLEGSLNVDYAYPHYGIRLALKGGEYQFLNKKILLSDLSLEYDPCEIKLLAKCHNHAMPFWIQFKSACPHLSHGEIIICREPPLMFLSIL